MESKKKHIQLSEIDHLLLRPDSWIGAINTQETDQFLMVDNLFEKKTIQFNYGLYKIFDEIITNSIDEHIRNSNLNIIKINVDNKSIVVEDNGGIITDYDKEYECYVPELIFGRLRTSSNYNDNEKRKTAGTNGVGAKAANVYSLEFNVETCYNKVLYKQQWTNNMKSKSEPVITKLRKENNYTKISFVPDLKRFGLTEITDEMLSVMKKRANDLAALNNNIEIIFNGDKIKFKSFEEYCKLYSIEDELFFFENENWKVGITVSSNGFRQVSFANNTFNNLGGTHVDYILNQIIDYVRPIINKKHKIDIKPSDIRNQLFLFVSAKIINNKFSSQTKERLTTDIKDFGSEIEIPKNIFNKILKSEIVSQIVDWKKTKLQIEEKIELRKLNKKVEKLKVPNLIDCSSKERSDCSLYIFEGFSAATGAIKHRNPKIHGLYLLRGKILNTYGLKPSKILSNKELAGLTSTLGLTLGSQDISNLRYNDINIVSDGDVDGDNIASLMINFLSSNWIELFKQNKVNRILTPLMIIKEGKTQTDIYTEDEYNSFIDKNKDKKYIIEYKKGLGALSDIDYKNILEKPKVLKIKHDSEYLKSLENWFGNDSNKRKELLLNI